MGLLLLSGGLDSAANLALLSDRGQKPFALTFDYGQKAAKSEWKAAQALAQHYGVEWRGIELPFLGSWSQSSLNIESKVLPEFNEKELGQLDVVQKSAKSVWVPNRNGVFLEIAASLAEAMGISKIYVGFNREEAVTFPDNSVGYRNALNQALSFSTQGRVQVESLTETMDKLEIVTALRSLKNPFPFSLLWSCYQGGETSCGVCESCARLKRALRVGGA